MIPYLERLLSDSHGEVRKTAAEDWVIRDLTGGTLTDSDPDVLIAALESIRIGHIAGPIDLLRPLLTHSDTEVVLRALKHLFLFKRGLMMLHS